MKRHLMKITAMGAFAMVMLPLAALAQKQKWSVVVNNGDLMPDSNRSFNSYNPPSVNARNLVVFRARSKGGSGQPTHGVYLRDMRFRPGPTRVFDRSTEVPYPNNLAATFTEPPSFPRIDILGKTVASRGVHKPVWRYQLQDGSETRVGTTGVYVQVGGMLVTGASSIGQAPGFDHFSVPGHPGVKFDMFPGAPAVTGNMIVFKGNYAVGADTFTGIFYRNLEGAPGGGGDGVGKIASSEETIIPGSGGIVFGSTAPPSAARGPRGFNMAMAVFAGFDNEESPAAGGIYMAPIGGAIPGLFPLVEIDSQVPGEPEGTGFRRLGEGVSFDGRFVAFWGAWGEESRDLLLTCPQDGNIDRRNYCLELYPDGFATTSPVHQGIFVHDLMTSRTTAIAKAPDDFEDFLFWNFSGRVPGIGEGDEAGEFARWRSSAFVAASGRVNGGLLDKAYHVAFKARKIRYDEDPGGEIVDGIYCRKGPAERERIQTLVETGMDGTLFDREAIDPLTQEPLPVTEMAIERDGFRGKSIAVTISMGTEEAGWAGIYLTKLRR